MANRICSIDDCEKPAVGRGWCAAHWQRWRKHGDPLGSKPVQIHRAVDHDDGTRTCSKCGERKPLEQYAKVANATLGRRSNCKACRSAEMKVVYLAKQEAIKARVRQHRVDSPEAVRRSDRERTLRSPEKRRAVHEVTTARRRLRIANAGFDPTVTRANLRLQYGDQCFYCGITMSFVGYRRTDSKPLDLATVEHVVPIALGGSHTWDNAVLACLSCNCSKRHKSLAEWLATR